MAAERLGHYAIEKKLGEGGMGAVYLARDEVLGRRVAIKVLAATLLADAAARTRFVREARAVAALNHPGIAVLYETGDADGQPYLAMEYVEGRNLREEIERGGIGCERLLRYGEQLAAALEHAHSRGVLHRDIKSANVMLTADDQVKLLDFGLAQLAQRPDETAATGITGPGMWVGTLQYAPPEILAGGAATLKSDIYSLGVVLYEMACGQTPFAGLQASAMAMAILQGKPTPVSERNPALPAALVEVIGRATAPRAAERFASAGELLQALRGCAAAAPVRGADRKTAAAGEQVIAVLAFQNVSADASMDWLSTGIAETLTSDLKKVPSAKLVSPERVMSAQRAAGASAEQSEVGRKLGARWVVAGSYQRAGNRLRITPRVFEAASGELISTGKVDGSYDEVFELQDRVVQEVVSALRLHIDSSTMQRIVTPDTRHLQAYEEYAQGRVLFHQLGKTSLEDARKHFERALEVDADYAMAHSALGATYAMRYIHRTDADDLTRAVGHLERARELDPELAEPYPYLCYAYSRQGKLNAAIEAGERGVALQPDHVQAVYFLAVAYLLTSQQRLDMLQPAVSTLVRATAVDPGWTPSWFILVDMAIRDGQYERAEDFLKRFRELSAAGRMVNQFLGWEIFDAILLARRGCFQEALTVHQRAHELMAARDHMYRETLMAANACCAGELRLRDNDGANALHDFRRARQLVQEYPRMLGADRVRARAASGFAAAYYQLGDSAHGEEQLRAARESMSEVERMPQTLVFTCDTGTLQYSLATAECLAGAREEALAALGHTTEAGFGDAQWLASDPVFSDVRSTERFAALLATLQSRPKLDFTISNSSAMAPRASVVAQ